VITSIKILNLMAVTLQRHSFIKEGVNYEKTSQNGFDREFVMFDGFSRVSRFE
jgi:hypothetical protein